MTVDLHASRSLLEWMLLSSRNRSPSSLHSASAMQDMANISNAGLFEPFLNSSLSHLSLQSAHGQHRTRKLAEDR